MSRLAVLAEACVIILTPFVVIASIPYFGTTVKMFPDVLHSPLTALVEFLSIYPAVVMLLIFSGAIFGQSVQSAYYSAGPKKLAGEVINKSGTRSGGTLSIAGSFSGRLMNGYLAATITSPATNDKVLLFLDGESGLGKLHGSYADEPFLMKWNIPESAEGEYTVSVELYDVYPLKLFRTRKFSERKAVWKGSTEMGMAQSKRVEICNVSVPQADGLRPFDSTRLPLAGWVCVTLRNNTDLKYENCTGTLNTDAGRFQLHDYGKAATHIAGNGKLDASFDLPAGAETPICANIIARTARGKIQVDLGDHKSLEMDLDLDDEHLARPS